jgi:hypothetical protein
METFFSGTEIELGEGKTVVHAKKLRSSMLARFREANPKVMEFCAGLIESGGNDASFRIHKGAIAGFPASEVVNMCVFLAEVTRDVRGFGDYDWPNMTEGQRVDFFDLEFSEIERLAYIVAVFAKFFAR